ncbi:hypothetical protein [Rhabdochromatium marinum]|uniref:hypothetical protein n=1 Tax=Rhabdochromatium marinum TaxID=48729 RepID=UPI001903E611|nr:hypothetical protein [Rhabdochromatium marinum]
MYVNSHAKLMSLLFIYIYQTTSGLAWPAASWSYFFLVQNLHISQTNFAVFLSTAIMLILYKAIRPGLDTAASSG